MFEFITMNISELYLEPHNNTSASVYTTKLKTKTCLLSSPLSGEWCVSGRHAALRGGGRHQDRRRRDHAAGGRR